MMKTFQIPFKCFCLIAFVVWFNQAHAQKEKQTLPNIVFILADDLGYGDVGAFGQQYIKTPHIDKLAKRGMKFTDFYAGSTVCAPSRAALMTGQHTGRMYIRGNGEVALRPQDTILPQRLKQAGYVNGMVGKWGLGLENTTGAPENKGWDFFTGHLHHVEGHYQQGDSIWKLVSGRSQKVAVPKETYLNELFTTEAIQFIEQNKSTPFFLYVSFTLPHAELATPQNYLKQYQKRNGESLFEPETDHPSGRHYGPQPQPKAAYAAMVTQMDDYIGRILAQLKKSGLEKNTIVIFTSDNGTHAEGGRTRKDAMETFKSSGPLKGIKRDLYEGGIRVPFIIQWPDKIKRNTITHSIGAFWDLLPTFTELAGVPVGNGRDGISLLPVFLGKQPEKKPEYLYWEFTEGGFKQAVRQDNWKAIRFYKGTNPERTELYDLSSDIGEQNNLATKHPEKVAALEALMDKAHTRSENSLFQIK